MSDNPRGPGNPSDMHSSRSSGSSYTPVPQININTPASPSGSSGNNHQARNVIIGAIATICTSTLIYYITVYQNRNKPDSNSYLEMKEATAEAWKSYKAYENAYVNNLFSFEKTFKENASIDGYAAGLNTESKKFTADLTDLSETENIDKDLVKAFNRRLNNEKSSVEKINEYYANVKKILSSGANLKKIKEDYVAEEIRWSQYTRGSFERAINDIQEIGKILSERYGQSFSMNDFIIVQVQPQRQKTNDSLINVLKNIDIDSNGNIVQTNFATNLTKKDLEGTWNVDGDVVSLKKDGLLIWTSGKGKKATGTWKIVDDKLKIEATMSESNEKVAYTYRVSNLTSSSFTISQTESPYFQFDVTRIVAN
jgi:hypothetical protein